MFCITMELAGTYHFRITCAGRCGKFRKHELKVNTRPFGQNLTKAANTADQHIHKYNKNKKVVTVYIIGRTMFFEFLLSKKRISFQRVLHLLFLFSSVAAYGIKTDSNLS